MDVFSGDGYTTRMPIIPLPSQIEARSGEFQLTAETVILTDAPNRWNADYLQRLLAASDRLPAAGAGNSTRPRKTAFACAWTRGWNRSGGKATGWPSRPKP